MKKLLEGGNGQENVEEDVENEYDYSFKMSNTEVYKRKKARKIADYLTDLQLNGTDM